MEYSGSNRYETLIKSSLLYGAEIWRLMGTNRRELHAVDVFRRSLGLSDDPGGIALGMKK